MTLTLLHRVQCNVPSLWSIVECGGFESFCTDDNLWCFGTITSNLFNCIWYIFCCCAPIEISPESEGKQLSSALVMEYVFTYRCLLLFPHLVPSCEVFLYVQCFVFFFFFVISLRSNHFIFITARVLVRGSAVFTALVTCPHAVFFFSLSLSWPGLLWKSQIKHFLSSEPHSALPALWFTGVFG